MALENKKFLDQAGTTHLWEKIKTELDKKGQVNSVTAANDSIIITGTAAAPTVGVQLSTKAGNSLKIETGEGEKGLYVNVPAADTYTIKKDTLGDDSPYSAVYHLTKNNVNEGIEINIPKDMVLSSGSVVTKDTAGAWGEAGTYIELVLANATNDKIYVSVGSLIEYITGAAAADGIITINVDPSTHVATATIGNGTIPATKLTEAVQTTLNKADSSLQAADIIAGTENGTISVKGSPIKVTGLGSAAYTDTTAYDKAGAADDVYAAIVALTTTEIDAAIASTNN